MGTQPPRTYITDDLEPLFRGYVPVEERSWYPWKNPPAIWWKTATASEKKEFIEKVRKLATEDFFFFCDEIMRAQSDPHLDIHLHAEICHLLQNNEEDLGFLIPRNHLKSTICSVAYPIWRLGQDHNLRILISSDTKFVARSFMRSIKENITSNERVRWVFPTLKPAREEGSSVKKIWSGEECLVDRDKLSLKEPSIRTMSAGMDLAGTHWDLMLFDDIMTEKNAKNEEVIKTLIAWYEQAVSLRDRITREILVGTRYRFNDIYGYLMKKGEPEFYVREVIEEGKYIWPDAFNIKRVELMKRKLSPWVFSCQYYNRPVPPGDAEFESDWIKRWNDQMIRKEFLQGAPQDMREARKAWYKTLDIYMGCDPCRTPKKYSDYCAIMVVGVDEKGREFVLDFIRERLQTHKIVEKFREFFWLWKPISAKVEAYGGDIHVYNDIKKAMKDSKQEYWKVTQYEKSPWVKGTDRIRVLQTPMHDGMIYIGSDPKFTILEQELLQFPYGEHDDLITVLSYIHSQQIKPKRVVEEEEDFGSIFLNNVHNVRKYEDMNTTWMSA